MVSSSLDYTFHSKNVDEKTELVSDNSSEVCNQIIMEIHKRFADFLVCYYILKQVVFEIRVYSIS